MTDLQALIGLRKGDRSYEQLSKECKGVPTAKRLHMLATAPIKNFPDPDTIRGLSTGLRVTETTIVLAAAESLGLDVRSPDGWAALLPADTERIPSHMRDAILSVVHSAVHMAREGEVGSDGKPQPWRQATQQAGSAPKSQGELRHEDPEEITEEWLAEQKAAGRLAGVTYGGPEEDDPEAAEIYDIDPEARRH